MALHSDDTSFADDQENEVNQEDLGMDMREQLGLDNQQDDDSQ